MKRIYFVCNFYSGRADVNNNLPMILNKFTAAGYEVTIHPTQQPGDSIPFVRDACQSGNYDLIVCSGGDGTLNEVMQGYMQAGATCPIGYIPFGTTNDFARGLGIPEEPEQAVNCIIHGEPRRCDVGQFNDKYFTYVAAFGAFTDASYDTSQQAKNLLGHTAYILNGMTKLPKIRSCTMRVEYDGKVIEGDFLYGMITNATSVGKLLSLTDVECDDGLFEMTLIRKPNTLLELNQIVRALLKVQLGPERKYLHYLRAKDITVTNLDTDPVPWTIDGEYAGEDKTNHIAIHRHAATFMVNPNAKKTEVGIAVVMPPKHEQQQNDTMTQQNKSNTLNPESQDAPTPNVAYV